MPAYMIDAEFHGDGFNSYQIEAAAAAAVLYWISRWDIIWVDFLAY